MPQPQPQPSPLNVPQALAQALKLHEQGRLAEAGKLYSDILAVRPEHFDALQMLALVRLAGGQPAEALRLVSAAMRLRKPSPQILLNHGLILNALERRQEALDNFDQAIKLKSKYAEAHNNRAAVLAALGRDEEALESYRKAVAIKPDYAEAHFNLGTLLRTLGRHEDALRRFDRALALRPNYVAAHNNRGAVLEEMNRLEEAQTAYQQALTINPAYGNARDNRSRVLCALKRSDEALDSYAQALALNPNDADAHYNRGKIFIDLSRRDDAASEFQRALAIKPDHAETRLAEFVAELPILYKDEDEIVRQRAAYERKLRAFCEDVSSGKLRSDLAKAVVAKQPFLLAYQGYNDRDLQKLYGETVCQIMGREYPAAPLAPPPAPGEPVRVGIVSSFFYLHSNWKIPIKGWIGQLDRTRFKIFGYHLGSKRDAETDAAASLCDRFVHRTLDIGGWRRLILNDAPHVLIYPGLLMDNLSLQLSAQRLAAVQCTSWGHPETSGMPTLDYFLSSDAMEPANAAEHYTERLVRLPNLSIYYEPVTTAPIEVSRAELGLRADAAAFWCGQSLYKYLPQFDCLFARIAQMAPHSQFVFVRHHVGDEVNEFFWKRLERAFAAEGLKASDHCVLLDRLGQSKFVAAMGQCDVFLDSIGWSGCNSALESLPHDLPIVTTAGALMRGRHSAAILQTMGMGDTVAANIDDYVAMAGRLANDPAHRKALAARIAENKHRVYRDRTCIAVLEDFLERAVRSSETRTAATP